MALVLAYAASADARYLPRWTAVRAIEDDIERARREVSWGEEAGIGECVRTFTRYECQVWIEGDEPVEYDVERGVIYQVFRCDWVAVAKWRFRFVVVKRRELACGDWYESSR